MKAAGNLKLDYFESMKAAGTEIRLFCECESSQLSKIRLFWQCESRQNSTTTVCQGEILGHLRLLHATTIVYLFLCSDCIPGWEALWLTVEFTTLLYELIHAVEWSCYWHISSFWTWGFIYSWVKFCICHCFHAHVCVCVCVFYKYFLLFV